MKKRNISTLLNKSVKDLRESMKRANRNNVCSEGTDIVIEGFPRSGNSFTVDMLSILQEGPRKNLKIAHHTHRIENILIGRKLNKPIVTLIRRPEDAILSCIIYSDEPVDFAAQWYFNFYNTILQMDALPIVLNFMTVVSDFNKVVHVVNAAAGSSIRTSIDLKADAALAHEYAERRARDKHRDFYTQRIGAPNEDREKIKRERRASVVDFLAANPEIQGVYERVIAHAV